MMLDPDAPSLKTFFKDSSYSSSKSAAFREKTVEEKQWQQLELGRRLLIEKCVAEVPLEKDEEEEQELVVLIEQEQQETKHRPFVWMPKAYEKMLLSHHKYTVLYTVFLRTVGSQILFECMGKLDPIIERKVKRFQDAHVALVLYLDSLNDPCDAYLDMKRVHSLYEGLGPSRYRPDSRDFIFRQVTYHKNRETPLEIIRMAYPQKAWTPEEIVKTNSSTHDLWDGWKPFGEVPFENHRLYHAIVCLLNQIRTVHASATSSVRHALWTYYCSFLDLFQFIIPYRKCDDIFLQAPLGSTLSRDHKTWNLSDALSPWQMYGTLDTRTFDYGRLPNYYAVLAQIPLAGELKDPGFPLAKLYQKSLPFASHRRHIIKPFVQHIETSDGIWFLISRLSWVLLANLYPNDMYDANQFYSIRHLLRVKELCYHKKTFLDAIQNGQNSLIAFTILRMHILLMGERNTMYRTYFDSMIGWNTFKSDVLKMASAIRSQTFYMEDAFGLAREYITKTFKSPHSEVFRLKKKSCVITISGFLNDALEKHFFKSLQTLQEDASLLRQNPNAIAETHVGKKFPNDLEKARRIIFEGMEYFGLVVQSFTKEHKSNIMNMLIRMPDTEHRLKKEVLQLLMEPHFGGITEETLSSTLIIINMYDLKSAPKDFISRVNQFVNLKDFVIVCFYISVVALLDKISFIPLDYDFQRKQSLAMRRRGAVSYDIILTPCCETIKSLKGRNRFGTSKVAYDIESQTYVCSPGKKNKEHHELEEEDDEADDDDEDDEEDLIGDAMNKNGKGKKWTQKKEKRKKNRNQRKKLSKLPCSGQPVMKISLEGRALVFGNTIDAKKIYLFCPSCGHLHCFKPLNWSAHEKEPYLCGQCSRDEVMHIDKTVCSYCSKNCDENNHLDLLCTHDPVAVLRNEDAMIERHWFCKTHYNYTKWLVKKQLKKDEIWSLLADIDKKNIMRYADK
jgi:hypothetical protein